MPFPEQKSRPFTRANVKSLNLNQKGCYGLYHKDAWVYVGKGDIRKRLLDHLSGDNSCIIGSYPTHWVGVVTKDYDNEEKRLIVELNPACNLKVG